MAVIARCHGYPYDEQALLEKFTESDPEEADDSLPVGEESPSDSEAAPEPSKEKRRKVRSALEVMTLSGLACRDGNPERLILTDLGWTTFTFLGPVREGRANANNIQLLGAPLVRGLGRVAEYRAILQLMRWTDNTLTNEELNRALNRISSMGDVAAAAEAVMNARARGDPRLIGDRIHDDHKYGDPRRENDHRNAMNPYFNLAGAGGIIISLEESERRIQAWAVPMIDEALSVRSPVLSMTADSIATEISRMAYPPADLWRAR
jgi:hypothetical protein